jgi:hypothetical protein
MDPLWANLVRTVSAPAFSSQTMWSGLGMFSSRSTHSAVNKREFMFKRILLIALLLLIAAPVFAATHRENYNVPCKTLWSAVKDTLKTSGKYGIRSIDNEEMIASYNMGGNLSDKRINSVTLNAKGDNVCELQVQTAYSGLIHNDYGDFKDRVEKSLAKVQAAAAPATKPDAAKEEKPPEPVKPATEEKK